MSRLKSKHAHSASNAAITILIIAGLIIGYILFLSPADRARLLGEDGAGGDGTIPQGAKSVLFSQTPGRINPASANIIEHTMPSFMVFTVTNANEIKRTESLYVKNSAFSDKIEEMTFFYDSRTMNDLKLSFNVKKHDGMLIIWLNEYKIFEGDVTDPSPLPINLPAEYLKDKNIITFAASSTGAAFWRFNEYELENVLVSGKVTDYSGALSEQHFSMSTTEYENMEIALLEFLPDCPPREEGLVQILINNRPLYTSYPDCGVMTSIEVSKEFLKPGDNILVATTNTGSFLVDMPKLSTFLQESVQPVFYFNVPSALHEQMYYGQRGAVMTLRFADASTIKRGTLEINGFKIYFETQDIIYQTMLDPEMLVVGPNAVKISPQSNAIDVVELRADVV
ncbi:MAG: hypothetical protein KKF46_08360 [Nanoarchaeota archaeon]|nr:hypothetical protein [Nanoarchaeota archaeon]MBU1322342.1 hypothetical protein [Nanoarchaeota archaeon]MBU1596978.1 hypothetical protein [Nanoarchaeota archaeon]MBU2441170.1 hypothetical protein [Nanoarchaeota archaeon]